jgi:uncharacterized membrane protein
VSREGSDRGSVMLLGIGLAAVCVLALAVLVDSSAAYLQRRHLVAIADAAALAGAQSIDLERYYAEGATATTRLDTASVPARVRRYLALSEAYAVEGLSLDGVASDGTHVSVTLSAPLELPFLAAAFAQRVRVESRAQLAYRGGA